MLIAAFCFLLVPALAINLRGCLGNLFTIFGPILIGAPLAIGVSLLFVYRYLVKYGR